MATQRKSMRVLGHEREQLINLYLSEAIPIDQFEARPDDKAAFVKKWNAMSKRSDSAEDVIHYMKVERKKGRWVRLAGKHKPVPTMPEFTPEQTETLIKIFYENVTLLESGSDVLSYDDEILALIAKEFEAETGSYVAPHFLVQKLTKLRKRGHLPKIGNRGKDKENIGFDDIDKTVI